jgi:uncharacterized membrane protein
LSDTLAADGADHSNDHPNVLPNELPPGLQQLRWLALASCAGLVLLGLAWELWLAPTGRGSLAIKVLPLVAALPGLARWRLYTCRWLSLVVWLYVTEGLVRATSEGGLGQGLAVLEVVLSVILFVACAWQVRWRLRRGREAAARPSAGQALPGADGRAA